MINCLHILIGILIGLNLAYFSIKLIQADQIEEQNVWTNLGVRRIDNDTFYQILAIERNVIIHFYDHFIRKGPLFELFSDLVKKINETNLPVSAYSLCVSYYDNLDEKYNIKVPSIIFFRNGQTQYEYIEPLDQNKRTSDHLFEWVHRKVGSTSNLIKNIDEAKQFLNSNNVLVICFMKSIHKELVDNFTSAAEYVDTPKYGHIFNQTLFDYFNVTNNQTLLLVKKSSKFENQLIYINHTEDWSTESIGHFLMINSLPDVVEMIHSDLAIYESTLIQYNAFIFLFRNDAKFNDIIDIFSEAAKLFRKHIRCYFVDMNKNENEKFGQKHGVRMGYGFPRYQIVATKKLGKHLTRYRPKGDKYEFGQTQFDNLDLYSLPDTNELIDFFHKLIKNQIKPFYLSQIIPSDDLDDLDDDEDDGDKENNEKINREKNSKTDETHIPVANVSKSSTNKLRMIYQVVGATFHKYAKNPDFTSVIYFTGKWCMGCNITIHERLPKLAQYYHRIGRKDLLFGYSDYELNDYEGLKATKMPRLKIFPKNSNDQIDFEGDERYRHIKIFVDSLGKYQTANKSTPKDPEDPDDDTTKKSNDLYFDLSKDSNHIQDEL